MHLGLHAKSSGANCVASPEASRQGPRSRGAGPVLWHLKIALLLLFVAAGNTQFAAAQDAPSSRKGRGHELFETACAVCHGLDGAGGEHAPNIARASRARSLPDGELLQIIREGILGKGMPAFNNLGDEKIRAILRELRELQGRSATRMESGSPSNGKELFFGKAGCADCHAMNGQGRFVSTDLTDYGYAHDSDEIQDAILRPQGQGIPAVASVIVTTNSGGQVTGLARNENNSSLQIQDREGRFFLFAKSEVRSIERSAGPAMPTDYRQRLTAGEITDIVSYIVHQTARPGVAGSQVAKGTKGPKEQ